MNKKIALSLLALSLSVSSFAYDTQKAEEYDKFYSGFTQKACANSKLFITSEDALKMVRNNLDITFLDIRTRGEHAVLSIGLKNSIYIPIKDLFKKENLDKLPKNGTIAIVCHSGTRATLAAVGLAQIGIKNSRVLQNGMIGLAEANNPKNAPLRVGMKI